MPFLCLGLDDTNGKEMVFGAKILPESCLIIRLFRSSAVSMPAPVSVSLLDLELEDGGGVLTTLASKLGAASTRISTVY